MKCPCTDCKVRRVEFVLSNLSDEGVLSYVSRKLGKTRGDVLKSAYDARQAAAIEEILLEAGLG